MIQQNVNNLRPSSGSMRVDAGGLQSVAAAPAGGVGVVEQPGGMAPAPAGGGISITVGTVEPGAFGARGALGAAAGSDSSSGPASMPEPDTLAPWLTLIGLVLVGYGLYRREWVPAGVGLASLSRGGRAGLEGIRAWMP